MTFDDSKVGAVMSKGAEMIMAWIGQMELEQPECGPLLQSTVEKVGPLPAIDSDGVIRTINDDILFWMASGYAQSYAGHMVEYKRIEIMGKQYPQLKGVGDEEGMIRALERAKFYETLQAWIESTEPLKRRMTQTPAWLAPFIAKNDS